MSEIIGIDQIKEMLPHRHPFLLVDRVVSYEPGKSLKAIKNVTSNEEFFNGHFPDFPVMPGVLIVEALAQSCGLLTCLTSEDQKNQVYLLTGVNNAKFREMVRPGDQLVFDVEFIQARRTAAKFSAKASVDGKLVCSAEINCVSKPPEGGESAPAKK